jgi:hypothetical protein
LVTNTASAIDTVLAIDVVSSIDGVWVINTGLTINPVLVIYTVSASNSDSDFDTGSTISNVLIVGTKAILTINTVLNFGIVSTSYPISTITPTLFRPASAPRGRMLAAESASLHARGLPMPAGLPCLPFSHMSHFKHMKGLLTPLLRPGGLQDEEAPLVPTHRPGALPLPLSCCC